jgi:hypothetical protein
VFPQYPTLVPLSHVKVPLIGLPPLKLEPYTRPDPTGSAVAVVQVSGRLTRILFPATPDAVGLKIYEPITVLPIKVYFAYVTVFAMFVADPCEIVGVQLIHKPCCTGGLAEYAEPFQYMVTLPLFGNK